jgi:hypothetical protein
MGKTNARAVSDHVLWHMKERRGGPGRVGEVDAASLDEETRYYYFLMWGITYNISNRAMTDRTFLPDALGLTKFTLPGRTKCMKMLNEWAEGVHERLKKRLLKDAVTCWVEADTTTQRGQKHVLASIMHYFDQKKKMRQWCYDIAEFIGPSLTADVMYPYMVTAAAKVGFTPAGFTSESASDMSKPGRKLLADSWKPEMRKYLKWLPLWVPCCLHQFSLILGAGLNCDKAFLKQIMAEVARQHNTYGFVSYMLEQAETARTKRVEQFIQALIAKAEADNGSFR